MQTDATYIITGRRSSGETVYYCNDATQGERFVPNAQDHAYRFGEIEGGKRHAKRIAAYLEPRWRGLKLSVELCQAPSDCVR